MRSINLIGGGFTHSVSSSGFKLKYIEWVKNQLSSDVSMYIDRHITRIPNPNHKNYAWLSESKTIIPDVYEWAKNNTSFLKQYYKRVFTHDVDLINYSDVFSLCQCSAKSFIETPYIYEKTKLVSLIASNKTFCKEHLIRQKVIQKFSSKCDHYGRGFNEIENKLTGLQDYCFSIAVENATYSNMFTEKLTDCFSTGTIPIYYGMKNISDYFDPNGIIILTEDFKIEDLSFDLYYSKIDAVKENFYRSINLLSAEDHIYDNYLRYEI
jgi:hypothetical protein